MDLAIVATGGDPGHAPAGATYEKAGFTPAPGLGLATAPLTHPTHLNQRVLACALSFEP